MNIAFLVLPNAPLTSVIGPAEILALGSQLTSSSVAQQVPPVPLCVSYIGLPEAAQAYSGSSLSLTLLAPEEARVYDWVIISAAGSPGQRGYEFPHSLLLWAQYQYQQGASLASSCTGSFFLAETGLLDGCEATTHWRMAGLFRKCYPAVRLREDRLLTVSQRLACAGGAHAYLDLSLWLVERLYGQEVGHRCARLLNLDANRRSQNLYAEYRPFRQHADKRIHEIQDWLDQHFSEQVQIESLASRVHLGERHFKRRFKAATGESPLHYLQNLRIEHARQSLESSDAAVESIARQVGYEDVGFFRTLFRRKTDLTPAQYRQRYRRG